MSEQEQIAKEIEETKKTSGRLIDTLSVNNNLFPSLQ